MHRERNRIDRGAGGGAPVRPWRRDTAAPPAPPAPYHYILWRASPVDPVRTYKLRTTYGLRNAPNIDVRSLHQLTTDEDARCPRAARVLRQAFYMDDLPWSMDALDDACTLQDKLVAIIECGGRELRKWTYNYPELVTRVNSDSTTDSINFQDDTLLPVKVNRVAKITETVPVECWRHVPSQLNTADVCSRGATAPEVVGNAQCWLHPPEWLNENPENTPVIEWKCNPLSAPRTGGLWEAGFKSAKYLLSRTVKVSRSDKALTFEELTYLFCKIEAISSSRPLSPLSDNPYEFEVLTAGHFLI
ncbi:hypothetical protein EVAR_71793_1, partial [Eumeta japonica]